MSTQDPLNATQSLHDSPLEAPDSHKETGNTPDSFKAGMKDIAEGMVQDGPPSRPSDGFPSLPPATRVILDQTTQVSKRKAKKRKGRKAKRKARLAGKQAGKPGVLATKPENKSHSLPSDDTGTEIQSQVGEEGIGRVGGDGIGLHPEAYKNVDQKGTTEEAQPIEGVEDVLGEGPIEEVETRAAAYAKVKAVWEKAGDVCVRVYARPLNPRLVLVEWEGEDGVEKHGKIVVGERQRGMFGPGKVVWVRGPLVGDRWVLAGKYNFLGNRVS